MVLFYPSIYQTNVSDQNISTNKSSRTFFHLKYCNRCFMPGVNLIKLNSSNQLIQAHYKRLTFYRTEPRSIWASNNKTLTTDFNCRHLIDYCYQALIVIRFQTSHIPKIIKIKSSVIVIIIIGLSISFTYFEKMWCDTLDNPLTFVCDIFVTIPEQWVTFYLNGPWWNVNKLSRGFVITKIYFP